MKPPFGLFICAVLCAALFTVCACDSDSADKAGVTASGAAKPAPSTPKGVAKAIDSAKAVASAAGSAIAAAKDLPHCERAYVELEGLVKTARAIPGNQANPKVPDKALFLATCKEAPAEMQKCLVMSYAMQHHADCKKANAKLAPALKAKLKAMMEKAMAKGK